MLAKPVLPVLEYVLNYEYIATELCENKDEPELKCNGKCHLMKELAKASEDEKPISKGKTLHQETEVLFYEPIAGFTFDNYNFLYNKKQIKGYSNLYTHLAEVSFFHPPALV
ncbi:hypothetical protein GCM10007424_15210 [Flavobacterium suaedae]|uniref:Uncharacterized protein n=2 Tax=Flavobacterium suaedae TaxID=1767027 RepID=A0ABQ1JSI7_9FLAO|nr:hypothetical protein [Flavobacterium suaedae]GGB76160.1 hypothetical protein GCM10007424_15210 [Flavobacterium suaedae]